MAEAEENEEEDEIGLELFLLWEKTEEKQDNSKEKPVEIKKKTKEKVLKKEIEDNSSFDQVMKIKEKLDSREKDLKRREEEFEKNLQIALKELKIEKEQLEYETSVRRTSSFRY